MMICQSRPTITNLNLGGGKMGDLAKLVGIRIKQLRKALGLTQEQLGERAQLQSTYIGSVERGDRNISLDTLEKVIYALEISPNEFFYFGDNKLFRDTEKQQLIQIFMAKLMKQNSEDIQKII